MNEELPITPYKGEILAAVEKHPVVILTAETGAGKSTQVPQYLLEAGYSIVVTQPRRLAARNLASRVAEEMGEELGKTVGYRTAFERRDNAGTKCLFVTDGLALVRELMGHGKHQILVLDEVHEWNLNVEVLCAWAKHQHSLGLEFKLVVMSATLEADKLATYYDGAPVLAVPGRQFAVYDQDPGFSMLGDTAALLKQQHNVLVFQPGKGEISDFIRDLSTFGVQATVLPLHGEQSQEEQALCFKHYHLPKCIVATNIAQTSITIDDIDAVVDSGEERSTQLVDGVEGLYITPISLSDSRQRRGRAGRVKTGIYIDWCPAASREEYTTPEILRTRLDQVVLRLAETGIDAEALDFHHQPPKEQIHAAKRALVLLGCMDDKGKVTKRGRRVAKLPISVQAACMILAAEQLNAVDDAITIASLIEQGDITARARSGDPLWVDLTKETSSDALAQLDVYKAAMHMSSAKMVQNGVLVKAYYQVRERRKKLSEALRKKIVFNNSGSTRTNLLKAVCAGMVDHLYQKDHGVGYTNPNDPNYRRICNNSVLKQTYEWVVGIPWDLHVRGKQTWQRGTPGRVLTLLRMVSAVQPEWLVEVAPHLAYEETGLNPHYDSARDTCCSTTTVWFNDQLVKQIEVPDPDHEEASYAFREWAMNHAIHDQESSLGEVLRYNEFVSLQAEDFNNRYRTAVFKAYPKDLYREHLLAVLHDKSCVAEVNLDMLRLPGIPDCMIKEVEKSKPSTLVLCGTTHGVSYQEGQPSVYLSGAQLKQLKGDVKLPDGTAVNLRVDHQWKRYEGIDVAALKQQLVDTEPLKLEDQKVIASIEALKEKWNRS